PRHLSLGVGCFKPQKEKSMKKLAGDEPNDTYGLIAVHFRSVVRNNSGPTDGPCNRKQDIVSLNDRARKQAMRLVIDSQGLRINNYVATPQVFCAQKRNAIDSVLTPKCLRRCSLRYNSSNFSQ